MAKYNYSINGNTFRTATTALAHMNKLRKRREKIDKVRLNGEPIMVVELEETARLEAAEKAHNKRQGL